MERFARIVLGYHGCELEFAEALIRGEMPISDWKPSKNPYDWLGHGIYFWEYGPERARSWRTGRKPARAGEGGVVGAVLQLGLCLDLTDIGATRLLAEQYEELRKMKESKALVLPKNSKRSRRLDCLVINALVRSSEEDGVNYQTVRCPFLEGEPAFESSEILKESHIQIAVRESAVRSCILGIFRPNLT